MRLITLNLWGGIVHEPLLRFIEERAADTDIFCFQEMIFGEESQFTLQDKGRINIFSEIEVRLPGFIARKYHAPLDATHFGPDRLPANARQGQAIFVKESYTIQEEGGFRCYEKPLTAPGEPGKVSGSCQWVQLEDVLLLNLHGLWQKDTHKIDTVERIAQSHILKRFLDSRPGKKLLCGDFNLRPDGESIKILEKGMRNLITESGATSTRNRFHTSPVRFADYILVSPDMDVQHFEVLQDEVSDHLPLLLDFS